MGYLGPLGPAKARALAQPKYAKPAACGGCSLEHLSRGYVPPYLQHDPKVLFVGEAPGYDEGAWGEPFVGAAGSMLIRILKLLRRQREEFSYHNVYNCFPGTTAIEAEEVAGATQRWYSGDLVTVILTDHSRLSGTPNHPVLTGRGWVPLGLIQRDDELIRGTWGERDFRRYPDVRYSPPSATQVFETLANAGVSEWVVGRDVDFHGDGIPNGDVKVVRPHGMLLHDRLAALNEQLSQALLFPPHTDEALGLSERALLAAAPTLRWWADATTDGFMRRLNLTPACRRAALCPEEFVSFPPRTERDVVLAENLRNAPRADAVPPSEPHPRRPREVGRAQVSWVKREPFVGHVYNFHTASNEYVANGFIVHNCVLPGGTSERQPWAQTARDHCQYLGETLAKRPKVIVPLGSVALKRILGLHGHPDVKVEGFHGAPIWSDQHQAWVIASYHPSHLQRGAVNLMGVSAFDYSRAFDIAEQGWQPDPMRLVMDPPLDWFRRWADDYIAAVKQDPFAYPLANDIETPDRSADEADDLTTARDKSFKIIRQNLCCHPDEGVTVPADPAYMAIVKEVLEAGGVQYLWFKSFDVPRQLAYGIKLREDRLYDGMWMAKVVQSDLPGGLGFWAPFHSKYGPWKHLAKVEPVKYACIDGPQTRRVCDGLVQDLVESGQWEVFSRHQHDFHRIVLQPATDVGVPIDRQRLSDFKLKLDREAMRLQDEIQTAVPLELCPMTPKQGLTRPPLETDVHTNARAMTKKGEAKKSAPDPLKMALFARSKVVEKLIIKSVNRCRACGTLEVAKSHRCPPSKDGSWLNSVVGWVDQTGQPMIDQVPATVRRWFWQEPLNPDSPPQVLALVQHWKLEPGRNKHTGNDSVDRETLNKLLSKAKLNKQEAQVGFFSALLDYKAVAKVRSTYVVGTEKRLDEFSRIHGQVTFKPSTMRTSMVAPNLQNVVADKGGKESLAAGFRYCVVARGQWEDVNSGTVYYDVEAPQGAPAVWRGSKIVEVDYAGIEAVLLGWCMRALEYIRIAKLGMHAYLASHVLGRPGDLSWPDADLASYFRSIKEDESPLVKLTYDGCKRVVHGNGYGQTALGVYLAHPKLFKNQEAATKIFDLFYQIAPSLPKFHMALRHSAHQTHFLGGSKPYYYNPLAKPGEQDYLLVEGHPYQYRHWFWSVVHYERLNEGQRIWREKRGQPVMEFNKIFYGVGFGEDAKRVAALYPQGIARGVLTEATFPLFDRSDARAGECFIGDAYFGRTPLRAPIHDSLLLEVPTRHVEAVIEKVFIAMEAPITALPMDALGLPGQFLTIGVDGKVGDDWGKMEKINPRTAHQKAIDWGVAGDVIATADDPDEQDDIEDLETRMGAV